MHDFHGTFSDHLHAANLRHGTEGFISPPMEGVLRIFSTLKIRRFRPGLNPRTWVLKASTLPLDHPSRDFDFTLPYWDQNFHFRADYIFISVYLLYSKVVK
jgi:hypothetical protein